MVVRARLNYNLVYEKRVITIAKSATQYAFKNTNYALYHNQLPQQQREKEYTCENNMKVL